MDYFSFICALLAAAAAVVGIVAFIRNNRKDEVKSTKDEAEKNKESLAAQIRLETTLSYIKDGVDDIRVEQKTLAAEQKRVDERIARLEEHEKAQDCRLARLEVQNYD